MNFLSIFDVIGPNMIGPSSSHTAGAVSIALLARKMFPEEVKKVTFTLYALSPKLTTDMELTVRCWGEFSVFLPMMNGSVMRFPLQLSEVWSTNISLMRKR